MAAQLSTSYYCTNLEKEVKVMWLKRKYKLISLISRLRSERNFRVDIADGKFNINEIEGEGCILKHQELIIVYAQEFLHVCFAPLSTRLLDYHIYDYVHKKLSLQEESAKLQNFTYTTLKLNSSRMLVAYATQNNSKKISTDKVKIDMQYLALLRFMLYYNCALLNNSISLVICFSNDSIYLAAYGTAAWGYNKYVVTSDTQDYLSTLTKMLYGFPIKPKNTKLQVYLLGKSNVDIYMTIANLFAGVFCVISPLDDLVSVNQSNISNIDLVSIIGGALWDSI